MLCLFFITLFTWELICMRQNTQFSPVFPSHTWNEISHLGRNKIGKHVGNWFRYANTYYFLKIAIGTGFVIRTFSTCHIVCWAFNSHYLYIYLLSIRSQYLSCTIHGMNGMMEADTAPNRLSRFPWTEETERMRKVEFRFQMRVWLPISINCIHI